MNHGRPLAAWYFFYFAFVGAFAPYAALYFQSLGISPARIAVLLAMGQVMRLAAPAWWGWLADRYRWRAALVRFSAAAAAACFLLFFALRDFRMLLLAMALLHFFSSAGLPLVEAITLGHLHAAPERYSRIRLWGSVGFIAAVAGVGVMLDHQPIDSLLWAGIALLVGTLACSLLLVDVPLPPARPGTPARGALNRRALVLFGSAFLMAAAHGPFYIFFSIHLDALGYTKSTIGALWALGVVAEIGVFLVAPRWIRTADLRGILLACFALAALRFMLTGWGGDYLVLLVVAQLLHGATFGAHHAAMVAALGRCFPAEQQARVQALYGSVSFGAGGMAGGLLAGQLWQGTGAEITFGVGSLFALAGLWLTFYLGQVPPRDPGAHLGASAK